MITVEKDEEGMEWVYWGNDCVGYITEWDNGKSLYFIGVFHINQQINILLKLAELLEKRGAE